MRFKYIIFNEPMMDCVPILFPEYIEHSRMANLLGDQWVPTSAGFVEVSGGDAEVDGFHAIAYGTSVSLKLGSKPEDSERIDAFLFNRR